MCYGVWIVGKYTHHCREKPRHRHHSGKDPLYGLPCPGFRLMPGVLRGKISQALPFPILFQFPHGILHPVCPPILPPALLPFPPDQYGLHKDSGKFHKACGSGSEYFRPLSLHPGHERRSGGKDRRIFKPVAADRGRASAVPQAGKFQVQGAGGTERV